MRRICDDRKEIISPLFAWLTVCCVCRSTMSNTNSKSTIQSRAYHDIIPRVEKSFLFFFRGETCREKRKKNVKFSCLFFLFRLREESVCFGSASRRIDESKDEWENICKKYLKDIVCVELFNSNEREARGDELNLKQISN